MAIIWAAALTVYDPDIRDTRTLYVATQGFVTSATDTPANTHFDERIVQAVDISRHICGPGRTTGRSTLSVGDLVLANGDGALDRWLQYGFDGRGCVLYRGESGAAFPSGFTQFAVVMEQADLAAGTFRVKLRDARFALNVPLLTERYAGDNELPNGLEGVVGDLMGRVKPLLEGVALNIPAVCVNTSKLIYQVSTEDVAVFLAVYDKGVELTQGGVYASIEELLADTVAPAAGEFKVYIDGPTYFRLGSSPDGQVTCDVTDFTFDFAALFKSLLGRAGFTSSSWNEVELFEIVVRGIEIEPEFTVMGFWFNEETQISEALDKMASHLGGGWWADKSGVLHILRVLAPNYYNFERRITENDILSIEREAPQDARLPVWSLLLRYAKIYQTQSAADLAAGVTDARRSELAKEWKEVFAQNEAVRAAHPNAGEMVAEMYRFPEEDTAAGAQPEALRRLSLYDRRRDVFRVTVEMNDTWEQVDLGFTVHVRHPRFGLTSLVGDAEDRGHPFLVIGVEPNAKARRITLLLWGTAGIWANMVDDVGDYLVTDNGEYLISGEVSQRETLGLSIMEMPGPVMAGVGTVT